ncbi:MAG: glutamate-5-semialdehyde dehydrogenase [Firmicutes bacterium]|nr:glutamate-5-semialdehyde dehydrogenase [Bacillota bacterium]
MSELYLKSKLAFESAKKLAIKSSSEKCDALKRMADALQNSHGAILKANKIDMENNLELSKALKDRLLLTPERIDKMAEGLRDVASLEDPVGREIYMTKRPNGLKIRKVQVPIGVIGIIYEARPNVTADAAALCLMSGNAVVLRGGKEANNSNIAIARVLRSALEESNLPVEALQVIEDTDRGIVAEMVKLREFLDLIIPRGGAGLIRFVADNATVPVVETGVGNCHVYIDKEADLSMAKNIIINGKCQRPGVCNAIEKVLIHESIANEFLPIIYKELKERGVLVKGCPYARQFVSELEMAETVDWETEYLDLVVAIRVIESLDDALMHIDRYSSKHSEAIVTSNYFTAKRFQEEVDAAAVYVNASTRFTDGSEFGLGAEIGISTQKMHARGPMGINELTTVKYVIEGEGQVR